MSASFDCYPFTTVCTVDTAIGEHVQPGNNPRVRDIPYPFRGRADDYSSDDYADGETLSRVTLGVVVALVPHALARVDIC